MKHSFSLMAILAVTLSAPLAVPAAAQDMSSFLNPSALAAQMGLDRRGAMHAPQGYAIATPRVNVLDGDVVAALTPEISRLAPATSIAPIRRGTIARLLGPGTADLPSAVILPEAAVTAPPQAAAMAERLAAVADAAPSGANVAVISGANTAVVTGANTAVIQSGPSPRLSFWQRWFGN